MLFSPLPQVFLAYVRVIGGFSHQQWTPYRPTNANFAEPVFFKSQNPRKDGTLCSLDSPEKCWENTSDAALFCKYIQRVLMCSSVYCSYCMPTDCMGRYLGIRQQCSTYMARLFGRSTLENCSSRSITPCRRFLFATQWVDIKSYFLLISINRSTVRKRTQLRSTVPCTPQACTRHWAQRSTSRLAECIYKRVQHTRGFPNISLCSRDYRAACVTYPAI